MKSMLRQTVRAIVMATVCLVTSAGSAQAVPIVGFNFNDATVGTSPAAPQTFTPDRGTGSNITLIDGPDADLLPFDPAATLNGVGTTVNAFPGDPAGADFTLFVGSGNVNNQDGFQFSFSTLGVFDPIRLSYATKTSGATGFTSQTIQFSTDGINFTTLGTVSPTTTYSPFAFLLPSSTNNQANTFIRFILDGGTDGAGSNSFDNIQVVATPEPGTMSLMGLGLIGLIGARRRRKKQT